MSYWLVKTEPTTYSIDNLAKDRVTNWHGVRNYQARNNLKAMNRGDVVLIYHSVTEPVGVAGLAKVSKTAYPDLSQFDAKSPYFDASAKKEEPRWFCPDLKFVRKFKKIIELRDLRSEKSLSNMILLQKGSRLSVMPLTEAEFNKIISLAE